MIGLDTNVLLRAATRDDPVLSPAARRFIGGLTVERPGYINLLVLAEFVWSLRRKYRYGREQIVAAVESLLASPAFVIAERDMITAALVEMQRGPIDFADALIGSLNRSAEADPTATFDGKAVLSPLFTAVPDGA
jgi:predicted nucleic-acid-binding protein